MTPTQTTLCRKLTAFSLAAMLFAVCAAARAEAPKSSTLEFSEKVAVGGPDDFLEVRHLVLRGSNFDIGKKLAEIAREQHKVEKQKSNDPLRTRAQRLYFQRNFSQHYERMRGAAAAFGESIDNDRFNFASLSYGFTMPGCSVIYYPPSTTADGVGIFSRNYDFTTGTLMGRIPSAGETPCTSRPYVVEMYPDSGYASLAIYSYDLLAGTLDGINAEGLTVALLADDELLDLGKADPAPPTQAGLEVIEVARLLLDTCANVEEAKVALLASKLYYGIIPCHYIVADRHGKSFLWENAASMHHGHIIDGESGKPQIVTNFLQHLHPEARDPSKSKEPLPVCDRYTEVRNRIAANAGKFSPDFIKQTSSCITASRPAPPPPRAAGRTLWHALYYPEQRRMEVDFYLGETPGEAGKPNIRRSGYKAFSIDLSKSKLSSR